MNIFILDNDISLCAKYHIDYHVVKMPVEMCQMMCTNIRRVLPSIDNICYYKNDKKYFYKSTHDNHPCTKWCRESKDNFLWTHELATKLCEEFTYRGFGKNNNNKHACEEVLKFIKNFSMIFPSVGLTPFAKGFKQNFNTTNIIDEYRAFYIHCKKTTASNRKMNIWTKRDIPEWYKE